MATQGTSGEESPTPPSKRERKPNIRLGDLGERKPSSRQLRARNRRSTDPSLDSGTEKQTETPGSEPKRSTPSTPRSTDPSPDSGTEKQTETLGSEPNSSKPSTPRSIDPPPASGTEKQKETPESEPKRSKSLTPRNRRSTEPSPDSGTEKQKETPESEPKRSKPLTPRTRLTPRNRRSTEPSPNSGTDKQMKTPDSDKRFKRPRDKPPADNSGTLNQMEMPLSVLKRHKPPANNSGSKNQQESSNGPARAMISGPIMDINVSGGAHDVAAKANDCISQNGGSRLAEMGGVHGWLELLGLAKYKPAFDLHEVDERALPLLTEKDLIDMGITAVGSRRKLYCAIQELKKGL